MAHYAGGRNIFSNVDTDIPPPGTYDVVSPENTYKKYGFLSHGERFRAGREDSDRPASSLAAAASRAEDGRLRREVERSQLAVQQQQQLAARDQRQADERLRQAEQRIRDLQRERADHRAQIVKLKNDLRLKDRPAAAAAAAPGEAAALPTVGVRGEAVQRARAEAAEQLGARTAAALDAAKQAADAARQRARQLEQRVRRLERDKELLAADARQAADSAYPRRLAEAERLLRARDEAALEEARKAAVALQEARDQAARYAAELGEATVHATQLERELQGERDAQRHDAGRARERQTRAERELLAAQARLAELERQHGQRAGEAGRMLRAAQLANEEMRGEVARLEAEREATRARLHGEIDVLKAEYAAIKRDLGARVASADGQQARRLADAQRRAELAAAELLDAQAQASELRGALVRAERAAADAQAELQADLRAAAEDFQALQAQTAEQAAAAERAALEAAAHVQALEQRWADERRDLLAKLDGAHKDGFRLRDALDALQRQAAQQQADAAADVRRARADADEARAALDEARGLADDAARERERAFVQDLADARAAHEEELGAVAERVEALAAQAGDAQREAQAAWRAREADVRARDERLDELADEIDALVVALEAQRRVDADAEAVEHWARLLRQMQARRAQDQDAWRGERDALVERVRRLEAREALHAVAREWLEQMLGVKEDARVHMVREARSLYAELQEQAEAAVDSLDAEAELARDIERLLLTDEGHDDGADGGAVEAARAVDSLSVDVRRAYIEQAVLSLDACAQGARARERAREMGYMRVHAELVEAAELVAEDVRLRAEDACAIRDAHIEELQRQVDEMAEQLAEQQQQPPSASSEAVDSAAFAAQVERQRLLLEQCEAEMSRQTDQVRSLRGQLAECEAERALAAEHAQFQITWLKEHHALAYRDLDLVLSSSGGGHTNMKQRIRYVEALKTQLLAVKKDRDEALREMERLRHALRTARGELEAYREVRDADAGGPVGVARLYRAQRPAKGRQQAAGAEG
ncbi:hypothetical protein LPJ53_003947 [Coemansia erecta]|uniref:Hyaluronan-mediated motility receptor C-terminal domain-containing protein n=1 Tax=Coemansia erecta TaxID=147472 RepID=A0A9W7XVA4_9FUNG|nr:hypothetical protein LPJ53_003947 [Coemansia erecta]